MIQGRSVRKAISKNTGLIRYWQNKSCDNEGNFHPKPELTTALLVYHLWGLGN